MSRSLNKVMLIGYTADEPQIRNFPNSKVANLTVVTNDRQKNSETGVYEEVPEWHRVSLWFRNADIVEQYVHKGTQVYIEGKIRTRSYTDNTGVKRYSTEIIGDQIILLSSRRDQYNPPVSGGPGQFVTGGPGQSVSGGRYPTGVHQSGPGSSNGPDIYNPINQTGSFDNKNYGSNTGTTGMQPPFPQTTNMNNGGMNGGMPGSDVPQVGQDPFGNVSNNALNQNNGPWGQPSNQLNVNSMSDANSFAGSSSISAMPEMASGGFEQGAAPAPAPAPVPSTAPAPIPAPTVEKGGDDEDIPF